MLGLQCNGNIITKKAAIVRHIITLKDEYTQTGYSQTEINFWNEDEAQDEQVVTHCYRFEAVHVLDHSMLYAASTSKLQLLSISTTKDGYAIHGKAETVVKYNHDWSSVGSLTILEHSLYVSHRQGIDEISLITHEPLHIVTQGVSS